MGSFEEILVKKHLKRTKARVMILKVLEKSLPLTAGEVYEAVRRKDMRLSLSTVYRNCEALAENGLLLRSTMLADGLIRYEYAHGTPSHHAVCLSCHRIFPVDVGLQSDYAEVLDEEYGFEAAEPRVEIYGYCRDCRATGKDRAFKEKLRSAKTLNKQRPEKSGLFLLRKCGNRKIVIMRRKIRYAFKSLLIISVHAGTEGFDLPQRGRLPRMRQKGV